MIIKWDNGHQKRKAQKAKIKEELMRIAWHHQDGGAGIFLRMRKKKDRKIGGINMGFFVSGDRIQNFFD